MARTPEISSFRPEEEPLRKVGILTILAGPTASGKSTVLDGVRERYPAMQKVVSTTTRPMREGEADGIDYHFLSPEEFQEKVQQGGFLETVQYGKNFYGTQKKDIEPVLGGQDLIWIVNMGRSIEIGDFYKDVFDQEEAQQLMDRTLLVLIGVSSLHHLRDRFRSRGSGDNFVARIQEDWDVWKQHQNKFPNVVINHDDQLEQSIDQVASLIEDRRRFLYQK